MQKQWINRVLYKLSEAPCYYTLGHLFFQSPPTNHHVPSQARIMPTASAPTSFLGMHLQSSKHGVVIFTTPYEAHFRPGPRQRGSEAATVITPSQTV